MTTKAKVNFGDEKIIKINDRFTVIRRCVGHAYPRNGNVDNPTPRFTWIPLFDGYQIGQASTLGAAKEIIQLYGR